MMHVGKRPDASSRGIVRPSADLLYAICPYDVSGNHTLLVTASMPERTYWSIAGYDDDTNNFFVRDNRQSGSVRINIYGSDRSSGVNDLGAVRSPTARGIVIVRILIDSEGHLGTLETAQKSARCTIQP